MRALARVVPFFVQHPRLTFGQPRDVSPAHESRYPVERVVVAERALQDVEQPLVVAVGVVSDALVRFHEGVVHHDQRPRGLQRNERPDDLGGREARGAEIGLA